MAEPVQTSAQGWAPTHCTAAEVTEAASWGGASRAGAAVMAVTGEGGEGAAVMAVTGEGGEGTAVMGGGAAVVLVGEPYHMSSNQI